MCLVHMIPGLENAEIIRHGSMHRNTFINAPEIINEYYQTKKRSDLFICGQLSGVEGYVESTGSAIVASINMARYLKGEDLIAFPKETALGIHAFYISHAPKDNFQPMNINYGIFLPLKDDIKKSNRKEAYSNRAREKLKEFKLEREE